MRVKEAERQVAACPKENTDVRKDSISMFGRYIGERYTPAVLTAEVSEKYGTEYIKRFGLRDAIESYLISMTEGLGIDLMSEDIRMVATAIIDGRAMT